MDGCTKSRRKSRRIPLLRNRHLIFPRTRSNISPQNETYCLTPLLIWKNGYENPFCLRFFPVIARRDSGDLNVASPMKTLHSDVLAESATHNARAESYAELGRLH